VNITYIYQGYGTASAFVTREDGAPKQPGWAVIREGQIESCCRNGFISGPQLFGSADELHGLNFGGRCIWVSLKNEKELRISIIRHRARQSNGSGAINLFRNFAKIVTFSHGLAGRKPLHPRFYLNHFTVVPDSGLIQLQRYFVHVDGCLLFAFALVDFA
jgi:hypothetical protein